MKEIEDILAELRRLGFNDTGTNPDCPTAVSISWERGRASIVIVETVNQRSIYVKSQGVPSKLIGTTSDFY